VCPLNRRAPASPEAAFQPKDGLFWPRLETLLDLSEDQWRWLIRGTALKRAKIKGLLRNLMVVVGNSGVRALAPRLQKFLQHEDEHVRSHAKWAIERLENLNASRVAKTRTFPSLAKEG